MRMFVLVLSLSLANFAAASAQTATPDSESGRYSFKPIDDVVLRLDTRTGQVSQCSRSDAGWTCKAVPDERSALETEIARLQGENGTLKKELLARGLPVPGVPSQSGAKPSEPELKLPSGQGDVVPREDLAPPDRDGENPSEGRREEELSKRGSSWPCREWMCRSMDGRRHARY